jgi:dUTP pyrophosphatase
MGETLEMTEVKGAGPVPLRVRRLSALMDLPSYQSAHAAGLDLHAALEEPVVLEPGEIRRIPCGFAMAVPVGYEAQVRPRSGLAARHGISMPNAPGTIDADYRGEVQVPLINLGGEPFTVERNMRIAQMVIAPVAHCAVEIVEALDETARGAGGFGSTGR